MKPGEYNEINIGTKNEQKMIKIGKGTSEKERNDLVNIVKEYRDVFAFTYDELKDYREDLFQHTIPLKQDIKEVKPFRQKLRQTNPKIAPIVKKELEKMLVVGIIAPTRHSSWLQLGGCKKKEWEHKNMYRFMEYKPFLSKGQLSVVKYGNSSSKGNRF